MGTTRLKMLNLFALLAFTQICAAQNDITLSVFTVTSKSITVQWSSQTGASFYKLTATPRNSQAQSTFVQFGSNTVMASVNFLSPNTLYTVQIEAMDDQSNVLSSAATEETTAPDVPSIEQAYSKHSDSITVEFTDIAGATSYILRAESVSGNFFSESAVSGSPGTVVGLLPYTHYKLRAMSVNAGGRSQPSNPIQATTVVLAPELNTNSTNSSILVNWPPVEHAVLYTLCIIKEGSSSRYKLNTTDTAVTFDDLEAGTNYCIKGTAWDSKGHAGDDITVCQITRPPSTNVTYVQITQSRALHMYVYWASVQGADGYIAWATNGQICNSTDHSFCQMTSVECGQNHSVTVVAYNTAGSSTPSEPKDYITYPCPPENIWVEEPEAGNCLVKWEDVDLVNYYAAFVKRDDGKEFYCNTTDTVCHFYCECGHTYLTTVFPYNQAGTSLLSHIRNYTTIPCCPQNVTVNLVSTETLEVMWSPVRGAELYMTTAAQTNDVIHCNDTAPVCALSDLSCDTVYSVTVTPCNDFGGCNRTCPPHTQQTAPCAPDILNMTQINDSTYKVLFTAPNSPDTNYTITAIGHYDSHSCHTSTNDCDLTQLPCGSTYEVGAVAGTSAGRSLPGFSKTLETGPCCPTYVNVTQVTQAMTNVTWSPGKGARLYVTSLTSPRGNAKCHTMDTHCLMGCITCGTNYTVTLEAISSTGHKTECRYHGFSSSACCPTSLRLYRMANNSLRVQWRSSGSQIYKHKVNLYGALSNHTCHAPAGIRHCDIQKETCEGIYKVVAAPVGLDGVEVSFCQSWTYSVFCPGTNAGMVISHGRTGD